MSISQLRATSRSSPKKANEISAPSGGSNALPSAGPETSTSKVPKLQSNNGSRASPDKQNEFFAEEEGTPDQPPLPQSRIAEPTLKENFQRFPATQAPPSAVQYQHQDSVPKAGQYAAEPSIGQQLMPPHGTVIPRGVGENGASITRGMVPETRGHMSAYLSMGNNVPAGRLMPPSTNNPFAHRLPGNMPHIAGPDELVAMSRGHLSGSQAHALVNRLPVNVPLDSGHMPRNIGQVRFGADYPGPQSFMGREQRMPFFHANDIRGAQPQMSQFGHTY